MPISPRSVCLPCSRIRLTITFRRRAVDDSNRWILISFSCLRLCAHRVLSHDRMVCARVSMLSTYHFRQQTFSVAFSRAFFVFVSHEIFGRASIHEIVMANSSRKRFKFRISDNGNRVLVQMNTTPNNFIRLKASQRTAAFDSRLFSFAHDFILCTDEAHEGPRNTEKGLNYLRRELMSMSSMTSSTVGVVVWQIYARETQMVLPYHIRSDFKL